MFFGLLQKLSITIFINFFGTRLKLLYSTILKLRLTRPLMIKGYGLAAQDLPEITVEFIRTNQHRFTSTRIHKGSIGFTWDL